MIKWTRRRVLHAGLGAYGCVFAVRGQATKTASDEDYIEACEHALATRTAVPRATTTLGPIDTTRAYRVQRAIVARWPDADPIAAYKGGATNHAAQAAIGANGPAIAALPLSGRLTSGATISLSAYHRLFIETEFAFPCIRAVDRPLRDEAALRRHFGAPRPTIELPDFAFASLANLTASDLVAANFAASRFVTGPVAEAPPQPVDQAGVRLLRDGVLCNEGHAAEVTGGQWATLGDLVRCILAAGYRIAPGQIILTGALGRAQPGAPGRYRADYGAWGAIDFAITA